MKDLKTHPLENSPKPKRERLPDVYNVLLKHGNLDGRTIARLGAVNKNLNNRDALNDPIFKQKVLKDKHRAFAKYYSNVPYDSTHKHLWYELYHDTTGHSLKREEILLVDGLKHKSFRYALSPNDGQDPYKQYRFVLSKIPTTICILNMLNIMEIKTNVAESIFLWLVEQRLPLNKHCDQHSNCISPLRMIGEQYIENGYDKKRRNFMLKLLQIMYDAYIFGHDTFNSRHNPFGYDDWTSFAICNGSLDLIKWLWDRRLFNFYYDINKIRERIMEVCADTTTSQVNRFKECFNFLLSKGLQDFKYPFHTTINISAQSKCRSLFKNNI